MDRSLERGAILDDRFWGWIGAMSVTAIRWTVEGIWFFRKRLDWSKRRRSAHAHTEINILLALLGIAVAVGVGRYREHGLWEALLGAGLTIVIVVGVFVGLIYATSVVGQACQKLKNRGGRSNRSAGVITGAEGNQRREDGDTGKPPLSGGV